MGRWGLAGVANGGELYSCGLSACAKKEKGDEDEKPPEHANGQGTRGARGSSVVSMRGGHRRCAGRRYGRRGAHSDAQEKHSEVQRILTQV